MMEHKQAFVPFTVAAQAVAGVVLILLGGVMWKAAGVADTVAHGHEQMATLQSSTATSVMTIPRWLMPLATLLDYLEAGETIDDFLEGFPSVTREQVVAFLEEAKDRLLEPIP